MINFSWLGFFSASQLDYRPISFHPPPILSHFPILQGPQLECPAQSSPSGQNSEIFQVSSGLEGRGRGGGGGGRTKHIQLKTRKDDIGVPAGGGRGGERGVGPNTFS